MSMTPRQLRRAAERAQRKADRKAGFPSANTTTPAELPMEQTPTQPEQQPEPKPPISEARLAANRANALLSKGALTPETRAISAQNRTTHGLARHSNGTFLLLDFENASVFESATQALIDEHLPETETETILVRNMAESNWLAQRAQRLQESCLSPSTGKITDESHFNLYLRYYHTHNRNFYKALQELKKLRAAERQAELGVEAFKLKQAAQTVKNEQLAIKKTAQEAELFIKEMVGGRQRGEVMNQILTARRANPEFRAELDAELIKIGLLKEPRASIPQAA